MLKGFAVLSVTGPPLDTINFEKTYPVCGTAVMV
jgi:hypothetical protein